MTRARPWPPIHPQRTLRRGLTPSALIGSVAAVVLVALLLATPARATQTAPAASGERPTGSDAAALRLIERAAGADATTTYEGTQFVASWGARSSSHLLLVRHGPDVGTSVRDLGTGGRSAPAVRKDDEAVSALDNAQALDLLTRNYHVVTAGQDWVAGRAADVIDAWRRAEHRAHPVASFWLDRETGVLLRRESYDRDGKTVRGSAFFDIRVDASVIPTDDKLSVREPPAGRVADARQLAESDLQAIARAGWTCPRRLADGLELRGARSLPDPAGKVMHLAYSDGLATVSVFEQRGRLDDADLDGFRQVSLGGGTIYVHDGIPQQLVWMSRDTVFTVVTDAPDETVAAVVAGLPRAEPSDAGLMARLGRGFARAAAWFASPSR